MESENIEGSINIYPGGMMAYQSGVAWGSEYKQEVRDWSRQSVMHEIEIMEEVLLQVMTRSGSWLKLSGLRMGKTSSQ